MPKEYINWPQPTRVAHQITMDEFEAGKDGIEVLPPAPRVGIHWTGFPEGNLQISMDIDWDVLQRYVDQRRENPNDWYGEEEGNFPNRATFYTESLGRYDAQRLIKHMRRARDAAFGADE